MEWSRPINLTKIRSFLGVVQYLKTFIPNSFGNVALLNDIRSSRRLFLKGKKESLAFGVLKKIINALVFALPYFQ